MRIIDPHLHLFNKKLGEYKWLAVDFEPFMHDKQSINRDFDTSDLQLPDGFIHQGYVHIEAGFDNQHPWREIQWLEESNALALKTIASIDLTLNTEQFIAQIERLTKLTSLCGVRHILDGQASVLLADLQVQKNLSLIADYSLIFECQLRGEDTAAIDLLCQRLTHQPMLKLVINHAAFPSPNDDSWRYWLINMKKLAKFPNVAIKASGWEMSNRDYCLSHIQHITEILVDIFGDTRVMLASNFPLCLFSCSYAQLWKNYSQLNMKKQQLELLMHNNAKSYYGFE